MVSIVGGMFLLLLRVVSLQLFVAVIQALHDCLCNHQPFFQLLLVQLVESRIVSTDSCSMVLAEKRSLCVVESVLSCRCTEC